MVFTKKEKNELLEYVALNLKSECNISLEESRSLVKKSILETKMKTSPSFIAHCSIGQLVDMVKGERQLTRV